MKKKIVITGRKLHDIGYRYFLMEAALNYGIERFRAVNVLNHKQEVDVFVDGEGEQLREYFEHVKSSFHPDAEVDEVDWQDYAGYVPKIESFALVFNVGQSRKLIEIGKAIKEDTALLPSIKEDTSAIKEDTSAIREDTALLPSIKEDTHAIKKNTESMPEMFTRIFDELDKISKALIKAGIER